MRSTIQRFIVAFSIAAGILGCTVTFRAVAPEAVIVTEAAPRTIIEVQTLAPGPSYVWIDGYWSWYGGHWLWVSGRWEAQRVGYVWVVPHYTYYSGRHYYAAGGWTQSKGSNQGYNKSNNKGSNQGYNNNNSNQNNSSNANKAKPANPQKGSDHGYRGKAAQKKCPKGYSWSNNVCRYKKTEQSPRDKRAQADKDKYLNNKN